MTPKIGAAEAARSSIHLLAQHLGEAAENLGRLLLGEGVLAVAELAAALPPSCRCWCWWEMIPEVRHNGKRAASDARAMRRSAARCGVPCASGSLRRAASTCNADGALRCAVPREPAVGFKAVGGVLTACFFAGLWGLGRVLRSGHAAGLRAGLCEPAAKSGWISRPTARWQICKQLRLRKVCLRPPFKWLQSKTLEAEQSSRA